MSQKKLTVVFRGEEESWNAFSRRIRDTEGDVIVVLSTADNNFLLQEGERKLFLAELAKLRYRVKLASKEPAVIAAARKLSVTVYDKTRRLRRVLEDHPKSAEALRFFSPSLWRQHWRSRLQSIGLLSLPKLRIWILILLSGILFTFVVFHLLPSAEIKVWPRKDLVSHTMNVVLVLSGATADFPEHARTVPLVPISATVRKKITFKDISPEFIGNDAEVRMTLYNKGREAFLLKKGSRLANQAGMVFRIQEQAFIPGSGSLVVKAKADHVDLYDKIVGDRGNVPANVEWKFPGLSEQDQALVYGVNREAARGGRTAYRNVLQQKDLDLARKRLEQELLAEAKERIEDERVLWNDRSPSVRYEFLNKGDLIRLTYSGFVVPMESVGKSVESIDVEGGIVYTIPAYDMIGVLDKFGDEITAHVGDGKELLNDTVHLDPERVIVIEYADNLSWIKMTVDIVGTEQYSLDPLAPTGAKFGKRVRESIAGLSKEDAIRIVRNLPEVDRVDISVWPPWSPRIPQILSNISLDPQ